MWVPSRYNLDGPVRGRINCGSNDQGRPVDARPRRHSDASPAIGDGDEILISTRLCMQLAFGLAGLLIAAHLVRTVLVLVLDVDDFQLLFARIDLNAEGSIPAWFSSALLGAGGALAVVLGLHGRAAKDPYWGMWMLLGLIFIGMSMDETVSLHETLGGMVQRQTNWGGLLYYSWVAPGLAAVAVMGLIYLKFMLALDARTRSRLIVAATFYLAGALGVEMLSAVRDETYSQLDVMYNLLVAFEEGCEMVGSILFVGALLDHMRRAPKRHRLRLAP